jgi:hypothetical protein
MHRTFRLTAGWPRQHFQLLWQLLCHFIIFPPRHSEDQHKVCLFNISFDECLLNQILWTRSYGSYALVRRSIKFCGYTSPSILVPFVCLVTSDARLTAIQRVILWPYPSDVRSLRFHTYSLYLPATFIYGASGAVRNPVAIPLLERMSPSFSLLRIYFKVPIYRTST